MRKDADSDEEVELTDVDKLKRARRRGIDPMDPAAYGDNVPVGGWSSGMNSELNEAADSSATGALFEKRLYPAPGAVLAKNRKSDK
uniref:Pre-mRNA-splicing factor SLU7 n=1 Tax=Panagrellus redivivus TaxID=6233 RepID=A0A7E4VEH1_PANRE